MTYTPSNKLSIITITDEVDTIPFNFLVKFLQEHPVNVIYVELNNHLYGLFSLGTIVRAFLDNKKEVKIRRNFTKVAPGEYMRALQILQTNDKINAIPIVTYEGLLVGEYLRWDDEITLLSQETYSSLLHNCDISRNFWSNMPSILMVEPSSQFSWKRTAFNRWKQHLNQTGALFTVINHEEANYIDIPRDIIVLLVDQDEKRSFMTRKNKMLTNSHFLDSRRDVYTYAEILSCSRMLDGKYHSGRNVVKQILSAIQKAGVHVLTLTATEDGSKKSNDLLNAINQRKTLIHRSENFSIQPEFWQAFFDDLYSQEYAESIASTRFHVEVKNGAYNLKNTQSSFLNVTNNRRVTSEQPSDFIGEIYFYGPCFIYGYLAEDKNTIESYLQRLLISKNLLYKVNNLGAPGNSVLSHLFRILETSLYTGDTVVVFAENDCYQDIKNLNLMEVLADTDLPIGWFNDTFLHCNHRCYEIFSKKIYETLSTLWAEDKNSAKDRKRIALDVSFLVYQYIENTFWSYRKEHYSCVGSIVMNCNPFTKGHRYLIEKALNQVDYLIVFVVEEDRSIFPFDMRLAFVRNGTADLKNVLVVPSGGFILSNNTFPEYFIKIADEDIAQNVQYDITLFAEQIAPRLGITCRFVGEEPEDGVTREYNEAMKRILPPNGIDLIEIPRLELEDGQIVSGSAARKALEGNDMEALDRLVPESTKQILFWENK